MKTIIGLPRWMFWSLLAATIFALAGPELVSLARGAEAPKDDHLTVNTIDPSATKLTSTRASVSKESEKNVDLFDKTTIADLRAERDALKKHVEEMEAAIKIIQQQRNQVVGQMLDIQLNLQMANDALAAARATPPPPNK